VTHARFTSFASSPSRALPTTSTPGSAVMRRAARRPGRAKASSSTGSTARAAPAARPPWSAPCPVPAAGASSVGAKPRPTRHGGTANPRLISSLTRIVDRAPAFQLFEPASCGPEPVPGGSHDFEFFFKIGRHGRTLARVSQEAPIGICDALSLTIGPQRRPFALEDGWTLLHRAQALIHRARPRPH
jgi:hypothetical protein